MDCQFRIQICVKVSADGLVELVDWWRAHAEARLESLSSSNTAATVCAVFVVPAPSP